MLLQISNPFNFYQQFLSAYIRIKISNRKIRTKSIQVCFHSRRIFLILQIYTKKS